MSVREDFEDMVRRKVPSLHLGRDKHNGQWSEEYNNKGTQLLWGMFKAVERISRPHDCGCVPCTGSCTCEAALRITVDCMRDIAGSAFDKAMEADQ